NGGVSDGEHLTAHGRGVQAVDVVGVSQPFDTLFDCHIPPLSVALSQVNHFVQPDVRAATVYVAPTTTIRRSHEHVGNRLNTLGEQHVVDGAATFDVATTQNGFELVHRRVPDGHVVGEVRSEEHTSELQSRFDLVCRLLLEKKKRQSKHQKSIQSSYYT